ncbi:putative Calpain catalytic domain-containing protein [Seiridium unicorne]|uniref:Calpain catalytic domain-containing protein n=1 Tax=Seiridium unicorne TaxID=138068 RepID=A0ABR2V9H1_9PEZI
MFSNSASSSNASGSVDPYALFEALTGKKINKDALSETSSKTEDYDDLRDFRDDNNDDNRGNIGREIQPDHPPKDAEVNVGAINPYALVEAMLGHKLDRRTMNVARIISDVLQTDYDELFDMKHDSVLYAGLKLNQQERRVEELKEKEVRLLEERDLVTPDLSRVQRLGDLEKVGLKQLDQTRIKMARIQNGKLRVVLDAESIAHTVSNREVTRTLNELATPFRREKEKRQWSPPNSTWRNVDEVVFQHAPQRLIMDLNRLRLGSHNFNNISPNSDCNHVNRFDDPVQGATSNSWLIAAIFSVFWADPSAIHRAPRQVHRDSGNNRDQQDENGNHGRRHQIRFHDKGGRNNGETRTVEVNYEVPINNSSNDPIYCRASGENDIWPALYEKAFAKWISRSNSERPDITQTAHGDPIKAMAQINGREPHYWFTERHEANDLVGVVRHNSVNFKAINPISAFTHPSGHMYRGSNLVANHAYSVLGWTNHGDRQYIIVRNPWGVTEPVGLTAYPGLIDRVEPAFWRPACMLDHEGVLAVEIHAFREYFACIGVAK